MEDGKGLKLHVPTDLMTPWVPGWWIQFTNAGFDFQPWNEGCMVLNEIVSLIYKFSTPLSFLTDKVVHGININTPAS